MTDNAAPTQEKATASPLVFISHDARDADFADALSQLLKSASAGMLKSFRSSDKRGTEGIEFGDEWYKVLMDKLAAASDVICILTERSLERPWILFEAGVAKGKLSTPVHGLALGVPLSRSSTGPFYQFQNSDDSIQSITKLVLQLCKRVPGLEPDQGVAESQVKIFKEKCDGFLKNVDTKKKPDLSASPENEAVAKMLEEMKLVVREIPNRIEYISDDLLERKRSKKISRVNPGAIAHAMEVVEKHVPFGWILVLSSFVSDEAPWLGDLLKETYRSAKTTRIEATQKTLQGISDLAEYSSMSGIFDEIYGRGREAHFVMRHFNDLVRLGLELSSRRNSRPGGRGL
jgi:TIR domain